MNTQNNKLIDTILGKSTSVKQQLKKREFNNKSNKKKSLKKGLFLLF